MRGIDFLFILWLICDVLVLFLFPAASACSCYIGTCWVIIGHITERVLQWSYVCLLRTVYLYRFWLYTLTWVKARSMRTRSSSYPDSHKCLISVEFYRQLELFWKPYLCSFSVDILFHKPQLSHNQDAGRRHVFLFLKLNPLTLSQSSA